MKPLKVCIFTETFFPVVGGGETQAKLLAEGLLSRGHAALILTRRSDQGYEKVAMVNSVPVYRLPPAGSGQLKKWGLVFSSIPALFRLRNQYDLLFVSGFRIIGISAVWMSKLLGKKCILKADSQGEMSGSFFYSGLKRFGLSRDYLPFRFFLWLRNLILSRADAFTVITKKIAAELRERNIPNHKIANIPNCVDTRRFHPVSQEQKKRLRQQLQLPQNATIFIYTGRLVTYKGLPLLLQVWQKLHQYNPDIYLLLVGAGGLDIHNCEDSLHEYVKNNHLETSVRFTGNVNNVSDYLQASDVYAFPTEDDAFPSSLVEAMSCGLAVVTTPVGAIRSIIQHQSNGLLIEPGDFEQLYLALEALLPDMDWRLRLGQSARATVIERYSMDVVIDRYISLFTEVLSSAHS